MTIHYGAPPAPADLLRMVSRLPDCWRSRYAVLRARLGIAKAARTVLQEYRLAAIEDSTPTDMNVLFVGGAS